VPPPGVGAHAAAMSPRLVKVRSRRKRRRVTEYLVADSVINPSEPNLAVVSLPVALSTELQLTSVVVRQCGSREHSDDRDEEQPDTNARRARDELR